MKRDEGTAVIELALVLVILLGLVIGTYEYGTAFAEKTAMATAVREGARAGSAAADFFDPVTGKDADCIIIEAAAGALQGMEGNTITGLWIYQADANGDIDPFNPKYQYYVPDDDDVDLICGGGNWSLSPISSWPPSQRAAGTEQWLGVKVSVTHQWKTGFAIWNGTADWEERAVMRIEPSVGQ